MNIYDQSLLPNSEDQFKGSGNLKLTFYFASGPSLALAGTGFRIFRGFVTLFTRGRMTSRVGIARARFALFRTFGAEGTGGASGAGRSEGDTGHFDTSDENGLKTLLRIQVETYHLPS